MPWGSRPFFVVDGTGSSGWPPRADGRVVGASPSVAPQSVPPPRYGSYSGRAPPPRQTRHAAGRRQHPQMVAPNGPGGRRTPRPSAPTLRSGSRTSRSGGCRSSPSRGPTSRKRRRLARSVRSDDRARAPQNDRSFTASRPEALREVRDLDHGPDARSGVRVEARRLGLVVVRRRRRSVVSASTPRPRRPPRRASRARAAPAPARRAASDSRAAAERAPRSGRRRYGAPPRRSVAASRLRPAATPGSRAPAIGGRVPRPAELVAHAPAGDHLARELGHLLDVVLGAGRDVAVDELLGRPAAERDDRCAPAGTPRRS